MISATIIPFRRYYLPVLLLLIHGLIWMSSCDLYKNETAFINPHLENTLNTYHEISKTTFEYIGNKLSNKDYSNLRGEDIVGYARNGFSIWARENGVDARVFDHGIETTQRILHTRIRYKTSSKLLFNTIADSLFDELKLKRDQRAFILQLPDILKSTKSLSELELRLKIFDQHVSERLSAEESEIVLKFSAVLSASMVFSLKNAKLLAVLIDIVEAKSGSQSYVIPKYLNEFCSKNIYHLAQSNQNPPPDWREYYNPYEMGTAVLGGALTGAAFLGAVGAYVGSFFLPPWGTAIGAVAGGFAGAIGGGFMGGGLYYRGGLYNYQIKLDQWCEDPLNRGHKEYVKLCTD